MQVVPLYENLKFELFLTSF